MAPGPRPPPRLAELRVADLTPPDLRVRAVTDRLDPILSEITFASFTRAPADDRSACRAELAVGYALLQNRKPVLEADAGEARAVFEGEVFCPDPDAPDTVEAFRIKLDEARPFGGLAGGVGPDRLEEVVRAVVRDGVDALFGQVRARHAADAELVANLRTSTHPGVLAESASEAGERRLVDAVPELVRLTAHDNRRVATRAGAALGLLKVDTPEVLRALVRMTEGPDAEKHLVAIHALADLGTPDARRYLENIAIGHPSPAMRQLARERLGRGAEPTPEPAPEPVPD